MQIAQKCDIILLSKNDSKTPDKIFTVWQPYYTSPAR
nr:MAG TPA: hypothetical protein [Bacteriophage sp.]